MWMVLFVFVLFYALPQIIFPLKENLCLHDHSWTSVPS
jgi:hypothetical protein